MESDLSQEQNLLRDAQPNQQIPDETIELLAEGENVRIERIFSTGHTSPEGFWYDSEQSEWVTVLFGEGKLRFEGSDELVHLKRGDHITIDAHKRHRVEWTSPTEPTIWLAVYYSGSTGSSS